MKKSLLNLGTVIPKKEQKNIHAGNGVGLIDIGNVDGICNSGTECKGIPDCSDCSGCYWHPNGIYKICR